MRWLTFRRLESASGQFVTRKKPSENHRSSRPYLFAWRHNTVFEFFITNANGKGDDPVFRSKSWWRHQMETLSALLAICAGNSPITGKFPAQRPVTRSFNVYFDLRPNKRLSKQSRSWWFETQWCPLWRHCNVKANRKQHITRLAMNKVMWSSMMSSQNFANVENFWQLYLRVTQYSLFTTSYKSFYTSISSASLVSNVKPHFCPTRICCWICH